MLDEVWLKFKYLYFVERVGKKFLLSLHSFVPCKNRSTLVWLFVLKCVVYTLVRCEVSYSLDTIAGVRET